MKILAADDHWVSRTGLRHSLSRLERPVNTFLEASSFTEARKLAAQHPDLDLIILDLLMPDGSGFEDPRIEWIDVSDAGWDAARERIVERFGS